jgi:hypothetical protein
LLVFFFFFFLRTWKIVFNVSLVSLLLKRLYRSVTDFKTIISSSVFYTFDVSIDMLA